MNDKIKEEIILSIVFLGLQDLLRDPDTNSLVWILHKT